MDQVRGVGLVHGVTGSDPRFLSPYARSVDACEALVVGEYSKLIKNEC